MLFVNTNNLFSIGRLVKQPPSAPVAFARDTPTLEPALFWDDEQNPCQNPPWGMLTAVDLETGQIKWKEPLSTVNLGGSIVTAGGLVFLGATNDDTFRGFDSKTGKVLWSAKLDALTL
jgi:quinoprotein glucose dehydrogenase